MNMAGSIVRAETGSRSSAIDKRRDPHMSCPACDGRAFIRSSEEVTPVYRRLYYQCSNISCSHTWAAALSYLHTIVPSGVSDHFRPPRVREDKPPGHDFGQMNIFEVIAKPPGT